MIYYFKKSLRLTFSYGGRSGTNSLKQRDYARLWRDLFVRLKSDDCILKTAHMLTSSSVCINFEVYMIEDAKHTVNHLNMAWALYSAVMVLPWIA